MNYTLSWTTVSKSHHATTTIHIDGDGYIVGANIRPGMSSLIDVFYLNGTGLATTKSVEILVIETYCQTDSIRMENFVPVAVVHNDTHGSSKAWAVFARYL